MNQARIIAWLLRASVSAQYGLVRPVLLNLNAHVIKVFYERTDK